MSFSYKDYINMYKAKGWYLPYKYFLENHLFDLKRGIDTHTMLSKNNFEKIRNLEHGVHYACSWESVIKSSFLKVLDFLKEDKEKFCFFDIGCGKGKVSIVWKEIAIKNKFLLKNYGIDYSNSLIKVAKKNYFKLFNSQGPFICNDITNINFNEIFRNRVVFYLYNPFNEILLKNFLNSLNHELIYIIYVYPVHNNILLNKNYRIIYKNFGYHPNETFYIYRNH